MEDFLIIAPLLAFMVILYRWMGHLGSVCGLNTDPGQESEYMRKDVLLFGKDPPLEGSLRNRQMDFDVVEYPAFPLLRMYRTVIAVSQSDLDNLLLCVVAKQRDPSIRTVALCNGRIYRQLFDQTCVDKVITDVHILSQLPELPEVYS